MKRAAILALIVLVGLPVGWFGAKALTPNPDRVQEGIALFVDYCLPLARHERPVPGSRLVALKLWPDEDLWFDARSGWLLRRDKGACRLDDMFQHLSKPERDRLPPLVAEVVRQNLPMLNAEDSDGSFGFDMDQMWMQYPWRDARRWGVNLVRIEAEGPGSKTMISLYQPREPISP